MVEFTIDFKMRPSREEYYMQIARATAKRSTCNRARVGAIAILNDRIVATGYNGSPKGLAHCDPHEEDEVSNHLLIDNHCLRTIHAEMNVICQAAKMGTSLNGATLYVTHEPCFECTKHLINVGVKAIVYETPKLDCRMPEEYKNAILIVKSDKQRQKCL